MFVFFNFPSITEGKQDGVEGQSFRFVNGEDANSWNSRTGDRTLVEILVPSCQEGLNVGSYCAAKVLLQLVEEGQGIDVFAFDIVEREDAPQLFCEEIERQLQQFFPLLCEFLGQDLVGFLKGDGLDGCVLLSEDIAII